MTDAPRARRVPITTRRGDGGYTSLWGGDEVPKYDPRPEAYGTLDEATAILGMARVKSVHPDVQRQLARLQNDLFRMMSELAAGRAHAGEFVIDADLVGDLEQRVAEVRDRCELPEMFVVSATETSAVLDIGRTVIRRAERLIARMLHDNVIENPDALRFLNRASDLAFVLARLEEKLSGAPYQTISAGDLD